MSASHPLVRAQSLSKRYGNTLALDALNLDLEAGQPIALIGPNGAGKTTLLSLLTGYISPSDGSVSVMGHPPGSAALHGQLSALPQDALLDPRFSVSRQLRFFARLQGFSRGEASNEVQRVLDLVQLSSSGEKRPSELSHGMRKRISIAQMLMGNPRLALMDEPTAGLDPPNARIIRELISGNASTTTFLVSSHNLDELEKICASVVYLSEGQLRDHLPIDQSAADDGYLTIRLRNVVAEEFLTAARQLPGVQNVEVKQQDNYLVAYNAGLYPAMDQALLQLLASNGWHYRQLTNGRTLEEKLF